MLKIIGAGFGRTGTLSLKVALERLGYTKCYHMLDLPSNPEHISYWEAAARGEPVDWPALFTGYQAIVDFPGCHFYRKLLDQYPQAKVILTTRDPDKWYTSALETILRPKFRLSLILRIVCKIPFSRRVRRLPRLMISMNRIIRRVWRSIYGQATRVEGVSTALRRSDADSHHRAGWAFQGMAPGNKRRGNAHHYVGELPSSRWHGVQPGI